MAMRTLLSALTLAACGIFSLAASGAEKKDLTVVPEAFKEKVPRSRNWTQRTNPLHIGPIVVHHEDILLLESFDSREVLGKY